MSYVKYFFFFTQIIKTCILYIGVSYVKYFLHKLSKRVLFMGASYMRENTVVIFSLETIFIKINIKMY